MASTSSPVSNSMDRYDFRVAAFKLFFSSPSLVGLARIVCVAREGTLPDIFLLACSERGIFSTDVLRRRLRNTLEPFMVQECMELILHWLPVSFSD